MMETKENQHKYLLFCSKKHYSFSYTCTFLELIGVPFVLYDERDIREIDIYNVFMFPTLVIQKEDSFEKYVGMDKIAEIVNKC